LTRIWTALSCFFASTAMAQMGDYMGPGVLTRGAGDIGNNGGAQLNLRFYLSASGVYDTGIAPFAVDSHGNLIRINGAYGEQLDFGGYGTHVWRTVKLGLDYRGDVYNYVNASTQDGSTHNLSLGLTYQKSRRLAFDLREIAGTTNLGYGVPGYYGSGSTASDTNFVSSPTSLLFDNRIYYIQSTMDMTFIQSARTSYTVGGDGFAVRRDAQGLSGVNGYNLRGSVQYRVSKRKTIGLTYQHIHFDFPPAYGQSDVNELEAVYSAGIGRRWTFSVSAGAFQAEVQGVHQVVLNPVIAALLGTSVGSQAFYLKTTSPSGTVHLNGHYRTSTFGLTGGRTVMPGNGLYLTSSQTLGQLFYSYTGIRKWNFGITGGYSALDGLGQGLQTYGSLTGGVGITYALTHSLHIVSRYDIRRQSISAIGYLQTGNRVTFGLSFSPGNIPLSLW
jgi:hypothetical protein